MDFYEELGLDRSATPEEIHRAYRNLVRLLHPDQQQDEDLRRLAECQTRRLNGIYRVLNDPIERKRYDSESAGKARIVTFFPDREVVPWMQRIRGASWMIAAVIGVFGISWYLTREGRPGTSPPVVRLEIAPEASTAPEVNKKRRRQPVVQQRIRPPQKKGGAPESKAGRDGPEAPPELPAPVPEVGPMSPPSLRAAIEPVSRFEGTWFYVRPTHRPAPALYPPEFIETLIRERDGWIEGRYRARYSVGDRAISPNVAFVFEGPAHAETVELPWTGASGAQGVIKLQLLSSSRLEITWSAVNTGTGMGLAAGTAVLVRRAD